MNGGTLGCVWCAEGSTKDCSSVALSKFIQGVYTGDRHFS